ncbi:hypothetical protein K8R32_02945 [bacterium]|nr:hypothetical protein [bacterium]
MYVEEEDDELNEGLADENATSSPDSLATSTPETSTTTTDTDLEEEINDILNPGS